MIGFFVLSMEIIPGRDRIALEGFFAHQICMFEGSFKALNSNFTGLLKNSELKKIKFFSQFTLFLLMICWNLTNC